MEQIVTIIHIIASIALIIFILLQQGKGAEAGASFGAGASQTIFGSQGTGSFLTRITALLAFTFFITSLILGYLAIHQSKAKSLDEIIDKVQQSETQSATHSENRTESGLGSETGTGSATGAGTKTKNQTRSNSDSKNAVSKNAQPSKEDHDIPKLPSSSQLPGNTPSNAPTKTSH
jgi:preprotein translocase subunit SecG